jgi:hypothetical protein
VSPGTTSSRSSRLLSCDMRTHTTRSTPQVPRTHRRGTQEPRTLRGFLPNQCPTHLAELLCASEVRRHPARFDIAPRTHVERSLP